MQFLKIPLQTFEWIVIIVHCCMLIWLTYVRFVETVNKGFLWYGIPWWYQVFHCLENTNLWKRFVALHWLWCKDERRSFGNGLWGFVLYPGPLVEEQMLYLEAGNQVDIHFRVSRAIVNKKEDLSALSSKGWFEFSYQLFK